MNLELVRQGAATVWLYRHERGKYADELLAAGRAARAKKLGLWGACDTVWDPYNGRRPLTSTAAAAADLSGARRNPRP